jgi:hypothetical protein
LWGVGRDCYQWEGDVNGNGIGRWIWCKYCIHMYVNLTIATVKTISGMGEGG